MNSITIVAYSLPREVQVSVTVVD